MSRLTFINRLAVSMAILLIAGAVHACATADAQLTGLSNDELIAQFSVCLNETGNIGKAGEIKDELIKRKAINETVELFKSADNTFAAIGWCYHILVELRSSEADELLRPLANGELTEQSYFANKYFAKAGEEFALENLNVNYFKYSVSSLEWGTTVLLFGEFKYYPASENLVSSIGAASLNLADASVRSLWMLYPETEEQVEGLGIQDTIDFYTAYLKEHTGEH